MQVRMVNPSTDGSGVGGAWKESLAGRRGDCFLDRPERAPGLSTGEEAQDCQKGSID